MHPHFADGALQLQVGVGLTRMVATPHRRRLFCSGTLCGQGYGGWFSPSRSCACTNTLRTTGY